MPQMAPLLWINLYTFFIIVFLLIIISNFFIKLPPKMLTPHKAQKAPSLQWKW